MENKRRVIKLLLIIGSSLFIQACSSVGYYWEKIQGHTELLNKQQPIQVVIDNPLTNPDVKTLLINAQQARNFASKVLLLPDNGSYRNYVDVGRDYVVWTVVATPPYSIQPEEWCFLIVGCLSYRGYFSEQAAKEFAVTLKDKNMDVYVSGAKAYSTLGWFDDPLLSTMLYKSEAYRVGIIFHELAHQKIYVENDTAFNEAFATSVELEGVKAWFNKTENKQKFKQYLVVKKRDKDFKSLLNVARKELKILYESNKPPQQLQIGKEKIFVNLQASYKHYKKKWNNYTGYDKWMAQGLNNAHLALVATYNNWLPAFSRLFENANGDYKIFYNEVKRLTELDKMQREKKLEELMNTDD
ncbi:PUTATIVE ZINC PROTEASE PROTEIN [hydrothermal vent metagenome]|uniref:PUTATIVE ZINC PROTEASE PROTEIN n=1 Tax=hydrothermal vent metagenome TaxID=652676 RepID=A0A3B0ZR79_9ZZZZ